MPRNATGKYSLPAGNPVVSGQVIESAWANLTMDDIAQALSDSLDIHGRGGMQAPFKFADGSVSAPGAAWVNEPTTGLYRVAPGDLRMSILGVDAMRWYQGTVTFGNAILGDITINKLGARIRGDFTTGTPFSNRVAFQTSVADGDTAVGAIPNGVAFRADWQVWNSALMDNCAYGSMGISNTAFTVGTGIVGTGTLLPLNIQIGNNVVARGLPNGKFAFGNASFDPTFGIHLFGNDSLNAGPHDGDATGASMYLMAAQANGGAGGSLYFGSGSLLTPFGCIRGFLTNGSQWSTGDLVVSHRRTPADTFLTESARFFSNGILTLAAVPTDPLANTNQVPTTNYLHLRDLARNAFNYASVGSQTSGTFISFSNALDAQKGTGYDGFGTFTAPVAGYYAFCANITYQNAAAGNVSAVASIQRNGANIAQAIVSLSSGQVLTNVVNVASLHLNAGDTVRVSTTALTTTLVTFVGFGLFSTFSGRRISEF